MPPVVNKCLLLAYFPMYSLSLTTSETQGVSLYFIISWGVLGRKMRGVLNSPSHYQRDLWKMEDCSTLTPSHVYPCVFFFLFCLKRHCSLFLDRTGRSESRNFRHCNSDDRSGITLQLEWPSMYEDQIIDSIR